MFHNLDYNKDGKVNWVDAAGYLANTIGPYLIILLGIVTPNIEREIKTTVITLGAGLAGTTQKSEKKEDLQEKLLNATINAAVNQVKKELGVQNEAPFEDFEGAMNPPNDYEAKDSSVPWS